MQIKTYGYVKAMWECRLNLLKTKEGGRKEREREEGRRDGRKERKASHLCSDEESWG
jgi:hypothetical protein